MVPAAACRKTSLRLTAEGMEPALGRAPASTLALAGAVCATMARAKCPAHIAPKHALRRVTAGRRRALPVLTHSRPPDPQSGPASLRNLSASPSLRSGWGWAGAPNLAPAAVVGGCPTPTGASST